MPAEQERGRIRQLWLVVHCWLGLGIGVFLVVAAPDRRARTDAQRVTA